MTTPNLPIGASNSGTNDWSDVHGEDQAIVDAYNTDHASGGHTGSWLTNATVTDAKLASPNNSVYRTLMSGMVAGGIIQGFGPATFVMSRETQGMASTTLATTASNVPALYNLESASLAVGSLTSKLRIQAQAIVGATSPSTVTFQWDLRPVTVSAGNYSFGSAVGSSATGSPSPVLATNTVSFYNSGAGTGDFTIPANGLYAVVMTIGSIVAPAGIAVAWQLQTRNV